MLGTFPDHSMWILKLHFCSIQGVEPVIPTPAGARQPITRGEYAASEALKLAFGQRHTNEKQLLLPRKATRGTGLYGQGGDFVQQRSMRRLMCADEEKLELNHELLFIHA